jgi:predicted O-methyltransferase YrrM
MSSWIKDIKKIITIHYLTKRLNLQFILGIISKILKEKNDRKEPWLTSDSIKIINNLIKPTDTFLEFGSGQSTLWFAKKVKKIISVEHDKKWYEATKHNSKNVENLKLIFAPTKNSYLDVAKKLKNNSIDICLVDGMWRLDCLLLAFKKIKVGGIIILDNAETFIPISWKSVSFQDRWDENRQTDIKKVDRVQKIIKRWRMISTSDVSQDTVLFIRNE